MGWLYRGQVDLASARIVAKNREGIDPWIATFHAQQAAEKCVKAALIADQVRFPRTHELGRLLQLLSDEWRLPDHDDVSELSRYAVAGRYPEGIVHAGPEPTWADADRALALAEQVRQAVHDGLELRRRSMNRDARDGA